MRAAARRSSLRLRLASAALFAAALSAHGASRAEDAVAATVYLGERPQPFAGTFARTAVGLGLEGAHVPERGWILRVGGTIETGTGQGFRPKDDLQLEIGCGQDDAGIGGGSSDTIDCNTSTDYALRARGGWSAGALAGEAGLLVRSDSFRHGLLDRAWLVSPDVVARFTGAVGDLSFGGGAYDAMTIVSPGLVDLDFAFGIGALSRTLLGAGFAILRGGPRLFHGCPDCSAMTSAALHFTFGHRFD